MFAARLTWGKSVPFLVIALAAARPAAAPAAVSLPGNVKVEQVDFERHVMGLFGRMGCNAGACHGSFQGKGGFRLSLFGYDPEKDYHTLTRDGLGRRVNPVDPDASLILLKATAQVGHGGGKRFERGSWQYRLLRDWIAGGARWSKGSGTVASLTVLPGDEVPIPAGQGRRLTARARFADGSEEDVTALCEFRVQDDAVAEAAGPGVVKALKAGDTALVVAYRGTVRAVRVLVPMPAAKGFRYPNVPEVNYIDREVFAKLRRLNMVPSDLAGDAEFLRRVTIDTIGTLPTPDEVRAFLADKDPAKRAKKIDELLAHPMHAALWATRFSDITGNNSLLIRGGKAPLGTRYSQMWQDWFRKRLAANMPYDEIVRGVLCATSRDGRPAKDWLEATKELDAAASRGYVTAYADKPTLDLFWHVGQPTLEQYAERTASAFMGIRLECAQCHKHPFDRWTQTDYRAYANVFGKVAVGPSADVLAMLGLNKKGAIPKGKFPKGAGFLNEVYVGGKGRSLPPPDFVPVVTKVVVGAKNKKQLKLLAPPPRLPAKALGGPAIPTDDGRDAREALFEWLRSPDNPYFARSFVNRVWGHYFGVGIVDPVDNFSLANPPSNPRLLDALAKDFIDHKYDIRRLERAVLNSRTYQLASEMNATNKLDRNNYAHAYLRPMLAEVVVDVVNAALGVTENYSADAPPGSRAIEVASTRIANPDLAFAFRIFGRPDRNLPCDCERTLEPALPQTLYLMTDRTVLDKIRAAVLTPEVQAKVKGKKGVPAAKGKKAPPAKGKGKKPAPAKKGKGVVVKGKGKGTLPPQDGRLARLLKSGKDDNQVLEELFLATLSRFPTEAEKKYFADYRAARPAAAPADPDESPKEKKRRELAGRSEREQVFADALWALINTREFILNH